MGVTPCDKKGTSKWVLPSSLDGWQGPDGSHQWEVAKGLLCLRKEKRGYVVIAFVQRVLCFFFSLQVTILQDKIVTCFYEYVMKRYEVL